LRNRVVWLETRERRVWAERIFAAAVPLLSACTAASESAHDAAAR